MLRLIKYCPHPTASGESSDRPGDLQEWGVPADSETYRIRRHNTEFYLGGTRPFAMSISRGALQAFRQELADQGWVQPDEVLFYNFLGYSACSGYTDGYQPGSGEEGMFAMRVSPHAVAVLHVLPSFEGRDLNDPETRREFYNAVEDQFLSWAVHEARHKEHNDSGVDPGYAPEATAIAAEYQVDRSGIRFLFIDDPTIDDVLVIYPDAVTTNENGEQTVNYNLLWEYLGERIRETCDSSQISSPKSSPGHNLSVTSTSRLRTIDRVSKRREAGIKRT